LTSLIADVVLVVHFCIVIFVSTGFVIVPVGYMLGWGWIANKRLRIIHAGTMTFVALETVLGLTCPLTMIENHLSGMNPSGSFIGFWIRHVFYWDLPIEFFVILYFACLAWTLFMWKLFPPRNKNVKK